MGFVRMQSTEGGISPAGMLGNAACEGVSCRADGVEIFCSVSGFTAETSGVDVDPLDRIWCGGVNQGSAFGFSAVEGALVAAA